MKRSIFWAAGKRAGLEMSYWFSLGCWIRSNVDCVNQVCAVNELCHIKVTVGRHTDFVAWLQAL